MSKIFNNTNKSLPAESGLSLKGWDSTSPGYNNSRISNIPDTVSTGTGYYKIGTSIPTPFARIYLFNLAFSEAKPQGGTGVYDRLVSECLDMLEFLFNYGAQVTVKAWNVGSEIQALKASPVPEHQELSQALGNFARDLHVSDIYLFYYNGVLIGGSSPYTLVFTSPNWQRNKQQAFYGIAGNELFPDYGNPKVKPTPLYQRDQKFREYLTDTIIAFGYNVIAQSAKAFALGGIGQAKDTFKFSDTPFWRYIYDNAKTATDHLMQVYYNQQTGTEPFTSYSYQQKYVCLATAGGAVIDLYGAAGQPFYLGYENTQTGATSVDTDYQIRSTAQRWQNQTGGLTPLMLSQGGMPGALYVGGQPWNSQTVLPLNPEQPLNQRTLPGPGSIQYPYLTLADLLDDKIVKTNYDIDTQAFDTFGDASGKYLPPLKPRIFDYFNPEDFGKPNGPSYTLNEHNGDVQVTLSIPVSYNNGRITLVKVYQAEDIVNLSSADNFAVAIFPSYKIVQGTIPNRYAVLLASPINPDAANFALSFYQLQGDSVSSVSPASDTVRTFQSRYLDIQGGFDLMTVSYQGATALLLPRFKYVNPDADGARAFVGIDFGTTNTYVALSYTNGADPLSLDISTDDLQTLSLVKADLTEGTTSEKRYEDSFSSIVQLRTSIEQQFVPLLIGQNNKVKIPFRTVTCENPKAFKAAGTAPHLFEHLNVGFGYMTDFNYAETEYHTDIKWDLQSPDAGKSALTKQRVALFCEQLAWMIKNKVMLSAQPTAKLGVFLTFPHTMRVTTRNTIQQAWQHAFDKAMGAGNVTINRMTEAIAPYNYLIGNGGTFTANALNIDIGGGTTDMLFADKGNNTFYYNSSLFAANDLWGDGVDLAGQTRKDNGFVVLFDNLLNDKTIVVGDDTELAYRSFKKTVKNSQEVMNYIFFYDDAPTPVFGFANHIQQSTDKLFPLLFVHLGALIYHVAQVLKSKKIDVPKEITFSGNGAKYIQIITPDLGDLTRLIKGMLATAKGYGFKDSQHQMPAGFKVGFQSSPKEATAKGAILQGNAKIASISNCEEQPFQLYGFEGEPETICCKDSSKYKRQVLKAFDEFITGFLQDRDLANYLKKEYDVDLNKHVIPRLKEAAEQSFDIMTKQQPDDNADNTIDETLFFWPLKDGLYQASKA